jgi:hypothetical protein
MPPPRGLGVGYQAVVWGLSPMLGRAKVNTCAKGRGICCLHSPDAWAKPRPPEHGSMPPCHSDTVGRKFGPAGTDPHAWFARVSLVRSAVRGIELPVS